MQTIEVVAAIIMHNNKVLCVQKPGHKYEYLSRKFEFPGGKIEKGETRIEALERELIEELNITTEVGDLFLTVEHTYPDFELTMHSFLCAVNSKKIQLNEHISSLWLSRKELNKLDWAKADIPIVDKLVSNG